MNQVFTAIDLELRKQPHYQGKSDEDTNEKQPSDAERKEPLRTASLEEFEKTFEAQQERMKHFFEFSLNQQNLNCKR